jgi:hypothetical protein
LALEQIDCQELEIIQDFNDETAMSIIKQILGLHLFQVYTSSSAILQTSLSPLTSLFLNILTAF